jgi:hypothetical protein
MLRVYSQCIQYSNSAATPSEKTHHILQVICPFSNHFQPQFLSNILLSITYCSWFIWWQSLLQTIYWEFRLLWNHLFIKHILIQYPNLEYVLHFIQGIYNVKWNHNIMFSGDCYVHTECILNICCHLLMTEVDRLWNVTSQLCFHTDDSLTEQHCIQSPYMLITLHKTVTFPSTSSFIENVAKRHCRPAVWTTKQATFG